MGLSTAGEFQGWQLWCRANLSRCSPPRPGECWCLAHTRWGVGRGLTAPPRAVSMTRWAPIPSSSHPMPPPIGSEDWCSSTRCPQPFPAIQAATALPAAAGPEPGFLLTPILKGNSRWIGRFLETSQTRLRLQTELLLFGKEAQLRPAPAVCAPLPIAHPPPLPPIPLTASPRSLSSCIAPIPLFWPPSVLLQGAQSPAGTTAPGALGGWTERRVVGFARGMWSELARKQSSPKSHPIIFPNQSTAKTSFRFG